MAHNIELDIYVSHINTIENDPSPIDGFEVNYDVDYVDRISNQRKSFKDTIDAPPGTSQNFILRNEILVRGGDPYYYVEDIEAVLDVSSIELKLIRY